MNDVANDDSVPELLSRRAKTADDDSVECLGLAFESEEARREHFLARLKAQLPELRERPDFPMGKDEDILRLSDPPYYTACPNPFLTEFAQQCGRPYDPREPYSRNPFAVDVSVGKTDPLYKAHGYHTKVPHLAIVPSILHYTRPGDIVLDGFCGSGMTGVAAQWCGTTSRDYRHRIEQQWKAEGRQVPEWGARNVLLGDLSPVATFIAANYNTPFDVTAFADAARELLDEVQQEIGWMYETLHKDGKTRGRINYTVWSEVFSCPECVGEVVFMEAAFDRESNRIRDKFHCPSCRTLLTKKKLNRLYVSEHDSGIRKTIRKTKRIPVFINYTANGEKYDKQLDSDDLRLLRRIETLDRPMDLPLDRMMHAPDEVEAWGDEWRPGVAGFSHVHHLFLPRSGHAISTTWRRAEACANPRIKNMLLFFVEQAVLGMSLLNRYSPLHFSHVNQYMAGRVRILSQHAECAPHYILEGKLRRLVRAFSSLPAKAKNCVVTNSGCSRLSMPDNSVDYVFTDPPFGHNLAYGELNFTNEAFLRVFTNLIQEAIVSDTQKKDLAEYQRLMRECFTEYHRVLKPGRWMTVVFHNSRSAVWNAIQEALMSAGFVVADVRLMDKQHGTFNQINAPGAVKRDLVISAYKPNGRLEERFRPKAGTEDGAWVFVRAHLQKLPVFVGRDGRVEVVVERLGYLLFDRMVAFHVLRGFAVPMSANEFYDGLARQFPERDGMFFLAEQVAEYDRRRMAARDLVQLELFVRDEESAIQWLRQQLTKKPQTFQEVHPYFIQELGGWQKHERMIELSLFLDQNFLCYDGSGEVPSQIHRYLSRNFRHLRNLPKDHPILRVEAKGRWYVPDGRDASDIEKSRERALLAEFDKYRDARRGELKVFRREAVRAGFRRAWQNGDYDTIIAVGRKLPGEVLHEDSKLLMWFDQALTRSGEA